MTCEKQNKKQKTKMSTLLYFQVIITFVKFFFVLIYVQLIIVDRNLDEYIYLFQHTHKQTTKIQI